MFQGICPGQSIVTATRLYYAVFSYCHVFFGYVILILYCTILSYAIYIYIYMGLLAV